MSSGETRPQILDTAEGVVMALRRCSLDQAFLEIVSTAKRHCVAPLSLAAALVAIAEQRPTGDLDGKAVNAARQAWAPLLDRARSTD